MNLSFTGQTVVYIAGDEKTGTEIANGIANAINKDLPWIIFADEQM